MREVGETVEDFPDLLGSWVLLNFYDLSMRRSCAPVILSALQQRAKELEALGCVAVGVAYDPGAVTEWSERWSARLVADPERSLTASFGALRTDFRNIPKRIAYLISPGGRVTKVYRYLDPDFFVDDVLSALKALTP